MTDEIMDDEPVFDRAYLRMLLTEVRPDIALDEFKEYANLPEEAMAALLAEVLNEGDAALYADEFNAPIICLTPLGAARAGVHLADTDPPAWVRDEDGVEPARVAGEDGFVLFADLQFDDGDGNPVDWVNSQADPDQLEPVEVLTNVEEFSEFLLLDRRLEGGELIPKSAEFNILGVGPSWPLGSPARATADTPSASTWQEQFTRCPFCRTKKPGETCKVCLDQSPGRPCPVCRDRILSFADLCAWCQRSGIDHVLPPAEVAQARRKPVKRVKPRRLAGRSRP